MRGAFYWSKRLPWANYLIVVFGVLAFLANASPAAPHKLAAFSINGDFVYDVDPGGYTVAPRVDRDQRQRNHSLLPPPLEPAAVAFSAAFADLGTALPHRGKIPVDELRLSSHLEQRTDPSRAPPFSCDSSPLL
ncbi:MAG TPA: hypothetical protein VKY54_07540 [Kiloniellales bacterium]|jgi:hypothetical protein|nr:hypothetical protein [Kiloniellales bacterium]